MTFTLSLLTSSASEVDWSRPLMIGWLVVALGLSLIEIWLAGAFSSGRLSPLYNQIHCVNHGHRSSLCDLFLW
jgi:hypothetical protein